MSSQPLLRLATHPHKHVLDRASSYLAIIDSWALRRGLTDVVREKTGGGKMHVVAALAAKSLSASNKVHPQEHYQRSSGLSPSAFKAALDYLQQAIDKEEPGRGGDADDAPRTPSRRRVSRQAEGGFDGRSGSGSPSSSAGTPTSMSLKERAMAVQSGQAFGLSPSSSGRGSPRTPRTPHRTLTHTSSSASASSSSAAADSPKSVRFSETTTPTQGTPRATAASAGGANSVAYEHPYTPSKRSRLGPQTTPRASASAGKRQRNDVGNEDDDDDGEDEEAMLVAKTPRRLADASPRQRRPLRAEEQLDIVLFPLDARYLAKIGRDDTAAADVNVKQWLDEWGDWLDQH